MRRTRIIRRLTVLAIMVLAMMSLAVPAAWAETFTVTTTDNPVAVGPCDAADCTLKEAITTANNNGQTDTINFAAGVSGEIELSSSTGGFSILNGTLTINGPGASVLTVDGNDQTRAFGIASGANATINGLRIRNGNTSAGDPNGGGISSAGTLTLQDSTVTNNNAMGNGDGGGIYSTGSLTLNRSTVVQNRVSGNAGGIRNLGTLTLDDSTVTNNHAGSIGGGIYSTGSLTIKNTTDVSNNTAPNGGGIFSADGLFTLNDSTVNGNTGEGGGIYGFGTLELNRSTVSNNTAADAAGNGRRGGGIYYCNGTTLKLNDSTVSNNRAYGGSGGGIHNCIGTVTLNRSTVSANTAGDGLTSGLGGGIYNESGTVTLNDSTVNGFNWAFGGGGIGNSGTLTLNDSTVDANQAVGFGGGIDSRGGTLTLDRSTVSNNRVRPATGGAGYGGGIVSNTNLSGLSTTIRNSTVSLNTVTGAATTKGGGIYNLIGLTRIENSTIAFNTAPAAEGSGVASTGTANTSTEVLSTIISGNANTNDVEHTGPDSFQSFRSFGYNLIGGGDATSAFNQLGDRTGVTSPGLGPLANNGGPTLTHALLPGSPAIDAGSNTNCPSPDQRGETRPKDGDGNDTATCDIGAFEKEAAPPAPPVARPDTYQAVKNKPLKVSAPKGVLKNDTGTRPFTAQRVTTTKKGTLKLAADGSLTYTPKKNITGKDAFTYRAKKGTQVSNVAKVSITIK